MNDFSKKIPRSLKKQLWRKRRKHLTKASKMRHHSTNRHLHLFVAALITELIEGGLSFKSNDRMK